MNYHSKVVAQIIEAIESVDEVSYAQKLEVLHYNSLGQHFRHILEFYLCLIEAKSCGIVNYDNRKRDLNIETDKSYAKMVAGTIQSQLETINLDTTIGLETCLGSDTAIITSNFSRELVYLSEHTIHHFALIKIGISTSFPAVKLCENFGVAESTIVYNKQQEK
jgi:hypothetical protein